MKVITANKSYYFRKQRQIKHQLIIFIHTYFVYFLRIMRLPHQSRTINWIIVYNRKHFAISVKLITTKKKAFIIQPKNDTFNFWHWNINFNLSFYCNFFSQINFEIFFILICKLAKNKTFFILFKINCCVFGLVLYFICFNFIFRHIVSFVYEADICSPYLVRVLGAKRLSVRFTNASVMLCIFAALHSSICINETICKAIIFTYFCSYIWCQMRHNHVIQ